MGWRFERVRDRGHWRAERPDRSCDHVNGHCAVEAKDGVGSRSFRLEPSFQVRFKSALSLEP